MELISKQQAIEEIEKLVDTMSVSINKDYCFGMRNMKERAISAVERIPEAIVRCRDCKWWKKYRNDNDWGLCEKHDIDHPCNGDWFCADGERRSS